MKASLRISLLLAALLVLGSATRTWSLPGYATQFRDHAEEGPSLQFPLGTDELGRDRLSRLICGSLVSLLLAPAAAALATGVALILGVSAAYGGGAIERVILAATDLSASVPWLFLLFSLRAILPLNVSPATSVCITFALLGLLGWTAGARVIRAAASVTRGSDYVLQARALGCRPARICLYHVAANLRPVITAQFWLSIPLFLLAEANMSMLGLGVTEPLPSWGNLLSELQNYPSVVENPWLLTPALLLMAVLGGCQWILSRSARY